MESEHQFFRCLGGKTKSIRLNTKDSERRLTKDFLCGSALGEFTKIVRLRWILHRVITKIRHHRTLIKYDRTFSVDILEVLKSFSRRLESHQTLIGTPALLVKNNLYMVVWYPRSRSQFLDRSLRYTLQGSVRDLGWFLGGTGKAGPTLERYPSEVSGPDVLAFSFPYLVCYRRPSGHTQVWGVARRREVNVEVSRFSAEELR